MSSKLAIALIVIGIILIVSAVLLYFFYWRPRHRPVDKAITSEQDEPDEQITEEEDQHQSLESSENVKKWDGFRENRKINIEKVNNDIQLDNSITDQDFKDIFSKPFEPDDSLFEMDIITNQPVQSNSSTFENIELLEPIESIDINTLDSIDDFSSRGFKNIETAIIENTDNNNNKDVKLISNELF